MNHFHARVMQAGSSFASKLLFRLRTALLLLMLYALPTHTLAQIVKTTDCTKQFRSDILEGYQLALLEAALHNAACVIYKDQIREHHTYEIPYRDGKEYKVIFFYNDANPQVFATVTLDSFATLSSAKVVRELRNFTPVENQLYGIMDQAITHFNDDGNFKRTHNAEWVLLPYVEKKSQRVYVAWRSNDPDVIIFGNDGCMHFKDGKYHRTEYLHKETTMYRMSKQPDPKEGHHDHLGDSKGGFTVTDFLSMFLFYDVAHWREFNLEEDQEIYNFEPTTQKLLKWKK